MNDKSPLEARNKASSMVVLRAAVCGYLIYLGITLIMEQLNGTSTMQPGIAWAAGVVFVAAGALFAIYSFQRYRAETKGTPEEPEGPEEAEAPEEKKETSDEDLFGK